MKWGVRKDGTPHTARSAKKEAKADAKWEKSIYTTRGAINVHNNVADQMNSHILPELNNRPKYKDVDLYANPTLMHSYNQAYTSAANKAYAKAVSEVHGTSPSGKKVAVYVNDAQGERIEVRDRDVAHASLTEVEPDLTFLLKRDSTGHVLEVNQAAMEMIHSENLIANILSHYGTKGMKWGVRKDGPATDVSVSQKTPGKFVKGSGGQRQSAHDDAIQAAAARQKARKSTTDSLSNKELQLAVQRMNLEQQYVRLAAAEHYRRSSLGKKIVLSLFRNKKLTKEASNIAIDEGGKRVKSAIAKRAALKAAAAAAL